MIEKMGGFGQRKIPTLTLDEKSGSATRVTFTNELSERRASESLETSDD